VSTGVKPANHIPTSATCSQCHTTAGNFALYSVTGTHQGVTDCLSCHAPSVANTFANVKIVSTTGINHFPIGNLDCNGSGCHTTTKVAGGFRISAANQRPDFSWPAIRRWRCRWGRPTCTRPRLMWG
jgi:hypothetical protein